VSTILVVSHDVVGKRMAGPAIRAVELGKILAAKHQVVLAAPNDPDVDVGLPVVRFTHESLPYLASDYEAVVLGGLTLSLCPSLAAANVPLVVDAYDPFTLENLQLLAHEDLPLRLQDSENLLRALCVQLRSGDFFLCASEKQRDFWLGMLHACGRINPYTYDSDPTLRRLIDVVPFGIPEERPVKGSAALKGQYPGIGLDDVVVLWGGGLYDWFDPVTAVRAIALAAEQCPSIRLFFMGVKHPNPSVHRMAVVEETRRLADELGLTGRTVFFNDWVPYERRADYLLDADIGLSLHLDHIETAFSFRTRILDYIWAGLPVVATGGDSLASLIEENELGVVVPPKSEREVADALLSLAREPNRELYSARAAKVAKCLTWRVCAEPLLRFCANPRLAPDREAGYSGRDDISEVAGKESVVVLWHKACASLRRGGLSALAGDVRSYVRWRFGL